LQRVQLLLANPAAALALSLICLAGFGSSKGAGPYVAPSGTPATTTLPRLGQTWSIATHNFYLVNRAMPGDLGPAIPLRSYRAGDAPSLLREPGNRSLLSPSTLGEQSLDGARLFLRDAARRHRRDLERLHGDERAFVCIAHTGTCAARDALIRDGGVVRSEA